MSLMPSQVKRSIYTPEFKIKVLEHYMKNGGESVFGLKSKTAAHFKIGKKTVHRIVESKRELLAVKARKARKAAAVAKLKSTGEKTEPVNSKIASPSPKQSSLNTSSQAKALSGKAVPSKSLPSKTVTSKTLLGKGLLTNAKESSHGSKSATPDRTFNSPVRLKESNSLPQTNSKSNSSKNEEILELPEDPDFSVLKLPIAGGVNAPGLAGPSLLLSTATQEVRDALIYECDIIYECKVCRNLFRSIVNFLAHKRIFCQSSYVTNKGVYSQGAVPTFSPHSSTVFSETEPEDAGTSQYYERLQKKDKLLNDVSKDCSVVLQDIKGVSGAVFQNVSHPDSEETSVLDQARDLIQEHEAGVTAVLNEDGYISSIIPSGKEPVSITESGASPSLDTQDEGDWVDATEMFEDEENEEDKGQNQRLGQELDLTCSECDRVFSGRKSLRAHLSKIHGAQRTIYTCPLSNCNNKFLSVWATGKHLQRTHKKSRLQVDNLRNTIKKNSYQQDNVKTLQGQVVKSSDAAASRLLDNVKKADAASKVDVRVSISGEPQDNNDDRGDESSPQLTLDNNQRMSNSSATLHPIGKIDNSEKVSVASVCSEAEKNVPLVSQLEMDWSSSEGGGIAVRDTVNVFNSLSASNLIQPSLGKKSTLSVDQRNSLEKSISNLYKKKSVKKILINNDGSLSKTQVKAYFVNPDSERKQSRKSVPGKIDRVFVVSKGADISNQIVDSQAAVAVSSSNETSVPDKRMCDMEQTETEVKNECDLLKDWEEVSDKPNEPRIKPEDTNGFGLINSHLCTNTDGDNLLSNKPENSKINSKSPVNKGNRSKPVKLITVPVRTQPTRKTGKEEAHQLLKAYKFKSHFSHFIEKRTSSFEKKKSVADSTPDAPVVRENVLITKRKQPDNSTVKDCNKFKKTNILNTKSKEVNSLNASKEQSDISSGSVNVSPKLGSSCDSARLFDTGSMIDSWKVECDHKDSKVNLNSASIDLNPDSIDPQNTLIDPNQLLQAAWTDVECDINVEL